ncbi:4-hydroxybenzoate polyprenyltransferase [Bradyrhizobium sp. AZCC 1588]|uniref:hypothetical protein n=1 Tax=Bradyrhizobium sp. AZCC 1588 TaxID=3117018 RepID=UPI002FEFA692
MHATVKNVPDEIASALEPEESVVAVFNMDAGLDVYATGQRFFGRRGDRLIGIQYTEVSEARRRTADWRTWSGITRIVLGIAFAAAGALTGVETMPSTIVSLALFLIGAAFLFLGFYRRDDWVELKIDRPESPPSFWYIVAFLPFWLMLRSRKRYRIPGNREQVDAFYQFLMARIPARRITLHPK